MEKNITNTAVNAETEVAERKVKFTTRAKMICELLGYEFMEAAKDVDGSVVVTAKDADVYHRITFEYARNFAVLVEDYSYVLVEEHIATNNENKLFRF